MVIVGCSSAPWKSVGYSQRPAALLRNLSKISGVSVHAVDTHAGRKMICIDDIRSTLLSIIQSERPSVVEEGAHLVLFAPLEEYANELMLVARELGFSVVYDCMELWSMLPGSESWYNGQAEELLFSSADYVIRTAHKLALSARDSVYVPNACDPSLWDPAASARDVLYGRRFTAGYIGSLGDWFDWDLLDLVSEKLGTDFAFNVIGDGGWERRPRVNHNVQCLGYRSPSYVAAYLNEFDVLFVPFRRNRLVSCVSPIKVYEALYCGVPVIATGLEEVRNVGGVRVCVDNEDVLNAFGRLEELSAEAALEAGSEKHTWGNRASMIQSTLGAR